jgi:broad specificity phosphatase PhoE
MFLAHVEQLNADADANTQYKIMYIMRRAHSTSQNESKGRNDFPIAEILTFVSAYTETAQDNSELDPALDDLGKDQCRQLAANFSRAMRTLSLPPPDVIVTSPLARALETTNLGLAPLFPSVRPIVLEGLREGLTGTGKNQRHGKPWIERNFPAFDVQHVDGSNQLERVYDSPVRKESYEALWQRVKGALAHVFENHRGATVVLLMSHCYVEQTIQREITGWDVPEEERTEAVEFFVGEARGYAIIVKGTRT